MGIINYVVPDQELQKFTYALAKRFLATLPSHKGAKYVFRMLRHYQQVPEGGEIRFPEIERRDTIEGFDRHGHC